ncbi:RHS repeat-associated core domain-containing protein, partial [Burkholderia ubonensis]|uniref:RHS repeat-associated core domain-containing protein n=1 Tax=Burkholderia ubonensis TaxID=101571 RepID=UPI000A97B036
GWRSYQPWLGRWLNPDPAGTVDGLNLYRMVRNNPITRLDQRGLYGESLDRLLGVDDISNSKRKLGLEAIDRQQLILDASGLTIDKRMSTHLEMYTYDSNPFVNDYLRHGVVKTYRKGFFPSEGDVAETSPDRVATLIDIVDSLPSTGNISLYRGGAGDRGTSGEVFRMGFIRRGDILMNTDFTSFTESAYIAREFASTKNPNDSSSNFDRTSVIFEIKNHSNIKAIAPYSMRSRDPYYEAESLARPGLAFVIKNIEERCTAFGGHTQAYMYVMLDEIARNELPKLTVQKGVLGSAIFFDQHVHDMRTGDPIDVEYFTNRLGIKSDPILRNYH